LGDEARGNLARTFYNQGQYQEASKLWARMLEDDPKDLVTKLNLGRALFHSREIEAAAQHFKEAGITISPEKYSPKYLPLQYEIEEDKILDFEYELSFLSLGSILNFRALSAIRKGNLKIAKEILHLASVLDKEFAPAHFNLGLLYFNSGEMEKAKKYCLLALQYNEYFLEAHNLMGRIYYMENNFEEAVKEFRRVVEIDKSDAMGHYNLGSSLYALQDWQNAEREWKNAIEYEGKQIKERKKEEIISQDEVKRSVVVREKLASFRAHKSLGWMYFHQGFYEKALKEFLKAIELEPTDPDSFFGAGKIFKEKGEKKRAIFYLEKYLYMGGKEEEEARKLLELLKRRKPLIRRNVNRG